MGEQRKLKLEGAAMLDKKISNMDILNNKAFEVKVSEIFSKLSVKFLKDFSQELRRYKKINFYPDLIYLMFWLNKYSKILKKEDGENLRLGRGLVFHICPSNVPTNFIYSFIFGLLSGNSNIVKVPTKKFKEKEIILSIVKKLFKKKIYRIYKKSNSFIQYTDKEEITKFISSKCDARVIWGGDKTINEIRKNWMPERSIDITFPDRYSLSLINIDKLKMEKKNNIKSIAKKFYYDGYMMNQMACNSPHFIFWLGKRDLKFQNYFWNNLNDIVEKKFSFDEVHVVDKYTNLLENIIRHSNFDKIKMFKNNLFIINPNDRVKKIENIRGINGTFFEKNIKKIDWLKKFITKKCQTISYYGISKEQFRNFLVKNNLFGIDRIVPIGKALEIDLVWDGYDVIKSLSRVISIE